MEGEHLIPDTVPSVPSTSSKGCCNKTTPQIALQAQASFAAVPSKSSTAFVLTLTVQSSEPGMYWDCARLRRPQALNPTSELPALQHPQR